MCSVYRINRVCVLYCTGSRNVLNMQNAYIRMKLPTRGYLLLGKFGILLPHLTQEGNDLGHCECHYAWEGWLIVQMLSFPSLNKTLSCILFTCAIWFSGFTRLQTRHESRRRQFLVCRGKFQNGRWWSNVARQIAHRHSQRAAPCSNLEGSLYIPSIPSWETGGEGLPSYSTPLTNQFPLPWAYPIGIPDTLSSAFHCRPATFCASF